jgi:hypothetical protein
MCYPPLRIAYTVHSFASFASAHSPLDSLDPTVFESQFFCSTLVCMFLTLMFLLQFNCTITCTLPLLLCCYFIKTRRPHRDTPSYPSSKHQLVVASNVFTSLFQHNQLGLDPFSLAQRFANLLVIPQHSSRLFSQSVFFARYLRLSEALAHCVRLRDDSISFTQTSSSHQHNGIIFLQDSDPTFLEHFHHGQSFAFFFFGASSYSVHLT